MLLRQAAVCIAAILTCTSIAGAAELPVGNESGWHSWRVAAVDAAPERCCFTSHNGDAAKTRCNLDGRHGSFVADQVDAFLADEVQVYALLDSGVPTSIRVLSAQCPVTSDSAINDLGPVDTDASVSWLKQHVSGQPAIASDAIAAVALHAGDTARELLVDTARSNAAEDLRETAIFWMGQARIGETAQDLEKIMFSDNSPDIREHAAFSYAQSSAQNRVELLIRQGRQDKDPDVRGQAWFWLAQTEDAQSERQIRQALTEETNAEVREKAIFALSQLPEDRAAAALSSILQDRRFDQNLREEALFWLAQTESDEAFAYIEKLLSE
jgi:HEAT repeat protein